MGFFKNFKKQKNVKRPKQVVFEKENVDNEYADFELKIKPRLSIDDGFPQGGYQLLAKRRNEMSEQIEAIIFSNYFDETSEDLASEIDSFPDTAILREIIMLYMRVIASLRITITGLIISKTDSIRR